MRTKQDSAALAEEDEDEENDQLMPLLLETYQGQKSMNATGDFLWGIWTSSASALPLPGNQWHRSVLVYIN